MAANNLTNLPLDQRTPITDAKGVPTPQFMRLWQLLGNGSSVIPTSGGFSAEGLLAAGETLAVWAFANDVAFDATTGTFAITQWPAGADAVMTISVGGSQVGTITFSAGETSGTVAWDGGSYTLAAQTLMTLYAPDPADATLADVFGNLIGG